jgi:seryl-tRNA synthetase
LLQLLGQRGNRAVKAQRGPRVQLDLAQRVVLVEHVHHAELIEIEAHVRFERACKTSGRR